jgi:hypothetical protein
MTKEFPMTNDETGASAAGVIWVFELRHSFVIRHSSFVILTPEARKA